MWKDAFELHAGSNWPVENYCDFGCLPVTALMTA
jgi:hypothetical protein